jgi:hypothetical protein
VKEHANLNAPATIVEEESIEPSADTIRCVRSGHCRRHRISLIFFVQGLINGQFNIRNLLSSGRYGYHSVPFDAGRSSGFYPSR